MTLDSHYRYSNLVLVSAIVSTYNSDRFIAACLEDLTNQSLYKKGRLEIIVIDSGSEQNEGAIVHAFRERYDNIIYLRTERETLYSAWNRGVTAARGAYLTNANTDDRHHSEAFEILANELDENPGIDLVYANCKESKIPNQTFAECPESVVYHYPVFFPPRALLHFQFGPQPMWRKSVHNSIGMFDSTLCCVGDYDFNIRFALKGLKAKLVPRILGLFYLNPTSITNSNPSQQNEKRALLRQYRTEENILTLFKNAGWSVVSQEDKAIALRYLEIKAASFSVPWSSRKDSAPDLAAFCHERARSHLQTVETQPTTDAADVISLTQGNYHQTGTGKKIAFFAGDCNNFHFAQPVMHYLAREGYEVDTYTSNDMTTERLDQILSEAALAWFEWGNGPIVAASHLPKRCPIICRVHRYEVYGQPIATINWSNIDSLIFVNRVFVDVFKELVDKDIERKTAVKVIPNAIREDLPFRIRTNNFKIAYISRFQADKNPALMIQILAKLVSIDPRYCVHMIGRIQDIQLYQYCLHLVKKLGLQENFHYEGTHEDVSTWLNNKSFILSTSIVESQGLAIMEAMMMGLKPAIHDSFGSLDNIYGNKHLFGTIDKAVELITSAEFVSNQYRDQVAFRYSSSVILPRIGALVHSLVLRQR